LCSRLINHKKEKLDVDTPNIHLVRCWIELKLALAWLQGLLEIILGITLEIFSLSLISNMVQVNNPGRHPQCPLIAYGNIF